MESRQRPGRRAVRALATLAVLAGLCAAAGCGGGSSAAAGGAPAAADHGKGQPPPPASIKTRMPK